MNTKEYYESEGIRLMDRGEDLQAKAFLVKAAQLGSEKATLCLNYLDMDVCDDDFQNTVHNADTADPFDYDFQPLGHVSYAGVVLQRSLQNIRNQAEYLADDLITKCGTLARQVSRQIAS